MACSHWFKMQHKAVPTELLIKAVVGFAVEKSSSYIATLTKSSICSRYELIPMSEDLDKLYVSII